MGLSPRQPRSRANAGRARGDPEEPVQWAHTDRAGEERDGAEQPPCGPRADEDEQEEPEAEPDAQAAVHVAFVLLEDLFECVHDEPPWFTMPLQACHPRRRCRS